jgi:hypothetical protein
MREIRAIKQARFRGEKSHGVRISRGGAVDLLVDFAALHARSIKPDGGNFQPESLRFTLE